MPQARGSQLAINIYEEDSYGEAPSSPSGQKVYPKGCTLSSGQDLLDDETLDPSRGKREPDLGNKDVRGGLPFNLAAEDLATLLKHAFGSVDTYRPVVTDPSNITGVTVNRAEESCATGDGTLSFTASGTTITWSANGDSAGASVDISSDGDYTLESDADGNALYITVESSSLPGTDETDTIPVVDAYEHEYTIGDLPTGLTIERDYGSNISGSGRFEQFHGCRVSTLQLRKPQNAYAEATFDFIGADSTLDSSALDASPTDNGHTSFTTSYVTTIEEGGDSIAVITEYDVTLDNELDEDGFVLGANARGDLTEGMAAVSGNITALFKDTSLLDKAYNSTDTSLRSVTKRGTGDGTSGNEYIETHVTDMKYERSSPEVSGPGGVRAQWAFRGFKSGTDLGLKMIVRNQVESP